LIGGVALVSAEQFITAVPGEQHFDALFSRQPRTEIRRDRRRIPERFVKKPNHLGQRIETLLRPYQKGVMFGPKLTSRDSGVVQFIKWLFLKSDGKRFGRALAHPAHHSHYRTAIRPSAQKRAYVLKRVALAMVRDASFEQ